MTAGAREPSPSPRNHRRPHVRLTTASARPSPLKSRTTSEWGLSPVSLWIGGPKAPCPSPGCTEIGPSEVVVRTMATMSSRPSPFMSPRRAARGLPRSFSDETTAGEPPEKPRRIVSAAEPAQVTTRSAPPSASRSPAAMSNAPLPTSYVPANEKVPPRAPRRIESQAALEWTIARSSRPSPSKSPDCMTPGRS